MTTQSTDRKNKKDRKRQGPRLPPTRSMEGVRGPEATSEANVGDRREGAEQAQMINHLYMTIASRLQLTGI